MKRRVLISFLLVTLVMMLCISTTDLNHRSLICLGCRNRRIIDKFPGEEFTIEIEVKNTRAVKGTWSVNIALEGEEWTWNGTAKTLFLEPCEETLLTWIGCTPKQAMPGSIARLVVYYNWSFEALDWWVHIIEDAELAIVSTTIE